MTTQQQQDIPQRVLHDLIAKDEINDALVRYCRGVDRRDAALVRSAYHEGAPDDHGFTVVDSGWGLAELCDRDNPNGFPAEWSSTSHVLSNVLIRVDGDRASSESTFVATMRMEHEGTRWNLVSSGRYVDEWERRDGGPFRISSRIVVTDETRTDEVPREWPGPDSSVPKVVPGAEGFPVPPNVPFGSATEADPSYRTSIPLV
ncbi:nuclear transport factor 2 family protein [Patulibacter sp. NPDC049589]|uniref:nuclear transport factor 2 family protein n=1 Tax=Patulibacter sp. NPDC049589 TaxID=3154731 RepID=UPI0034497B40